ncbi:hypothetical protein [Streptomyces hiroshimensis]|uniref:hypothetical protein n=1 Tax=Streptomyces hiroshimensis TaxID=66424 RepID=UPI00167663FE|nr:hypothetical protein [Streptomyces hiroshimensis]
MAELAVDVHPVERRSGIGCRLLGAAMAAAWDGSRRCVVAQAGAGSLGDRFLSAQGFRKIFTLRYARFALAGAGPGAGLRSA